MPLKDVKNFQATDGKKNYGIKIYNNHGIISNANRGCGEDFNTSLIG